MRRISWLLILCVACAGRSEGGNGRPTATGFDPSGGDTGSTSSGTQGTGSDGSSDTASSTEGERLDVGDGQESSGGDPTDCPSGEDSEYAFSLIWIANSTEGTVSKIDTETATELARYRTGPGAPDPSRTSVNLLGDVAVGNRAGSITKIAADETRCVDANGDGMITTSQGAADVLAWGEDECVLWHTELPFVSQDEANVGGPRAVAWEAGDPDNPCTSTPGVWVGWRDMPTTNVSLWRLDGETGEHVGDEVLIPDWETNQWNHGVYGAAIDAEGDLWALGNAGRLVRVDGESLGYTIFVDPNLPDFYGFALDQEGTPWIATWDGRLFHFDPIGETFEDLGLLGPSTQGRGMAIDTNGHAWIAGNLPCGLYQYDTEARMLLAGPIELPECYEIVGVSVDVDGMVWAVDRASDRAYKLNPQDLSIIEVTGLVDPYTYSDMTGAGLGLVVGPPTG